MKLGKGERVVAAWAESFAGPGWANTPILVVIHDQGGGLKGKPELRIEYIQPSEMSADMVTLIGVSLATAAAMRGAVERALGPKERK